MKAAAPLSSLHDLAGITRAYTNLLQASGVATPEDLLKNNPDKLLRWMAEVNTETRIVRRLPPIEKLYEWVEQARSHENEMPA